MKFEEYQCSNCGHEEFYGKAGSWVCRKCSQSIPFSLNEYLELEDSGIIVQAKPREL